MKRSFELSEASVTITRFSEKGRGIAHLPRQEPHSPLKLEIISGVPGDDLLIALGKKRRGKVTASLLQITTPSIHRATPKCAHVPLCGGCSWQQVSYSHQLKEKEELVKRAFAPFLQNAPALFHPILPSADPWEYRNKMEFSFSQNRLGERFLGLMMAGEKSRVFNLTECHLASSWFSSTLSSVREWWEKSALLAYYAQRDEGALRTLVLREGKRTSDKMAILTVSGNPQFALSKAQIDAFVDAIKRSLPEKDHASLSIFLRIQQIAKGSPTQFFEWHLYGPDHIREILEIDTGLQKKSLMFNISPTSFFQPNTSQAEILYSRALQMVHLPPRAHAFDLYCGTATLGMALSLLAESVTAIELNPHAVFDGQSNQKLNGISNLEILCGDVGRVLKEKKASLPAPSLVLVDPPRSGLDPLALSCLLDLSPEQILYVSCNPKTQAENVKILQEAGYQLLEIQPIDQFPHTVHVENIALLKRRG